MPLSLPPDQRRREKNLSKDLEEGAHYYVSKSGVDTNDGKQFESAFLTVQKAVDTAAAGDKIHIAPGDYEETVTITKDNLTLIGGGARTSVSIAPTTANANAIVIDGTTATGRVEEVTLININGDGNGTGAGLHVKGNIRRITAEACKFEAGDTTGIAVRLQNTGAGVSIGDVLLRDCEICWAATGVKIEIAVGSEQATEVFIEDCWFHNLTTDHIINTDGSTATILIHGCRFANLEAGTAPTGLYVDLRAGTSTGLISDCYFPVASNGGKVLVDAGVVVTGCYFTGGLSTGQPT